MRMQNFILDNIQIRELKTLIELKPSSDGSDESVLMVMQNAAKELLAGHEVAMKVKMKISQEQFLTDEDAVIDMKDWSGILATPAGQDEVW